MLESLKDLYISYPFLPVASQPDFFEQVKDIHIEYAFKAKDLLLGYKNNRNGNYVRARLKGFVAATSNDPAKALIEISCLQIQDTAEEVEIPLVAWTLSSLEPNTDIPDDFIGQHLPNTTSWMLCDQALIDSLSTDPPQITKPYELNPDVLVILQEAPALFRDTTKLPAELDIQKGHNVDVSLANGEVDFYGASDVGQRLYKINTPYPISDKKQALGLRSINGISESVGIDPTYPIRVDGSTVVGNTMTLLLELEDTDTAAQGTGQMTRIASGTSCAWSLVGGTFTCKGLPPMDSVFQNTPIDGGTVEAFEEIHYYTKLPQNIEGFVMTLSPIIDMSGGTAKSPEVPELACRTNFDPFCDGELSILNGTAAALTGNTATENSGFLDFYNQVPAYKDAFYVVDASMISGATISGVTSHMLSEAEFPVYGTTGTMAPGILEPMLDTMFSPVDIDMPPTPDLTTDAIIYSLAGLQSWRHTIDSRVSNISINATDGGMVNLQNALNQKGQCPQFNIVAIPRGTESETSGAAGSGSTLMPGSGSGSSGSGSGNTINTGINPGIIGSTTSTTVATVIGSTTLINPIYQISGGKLILSDTGESISGIEGTTTTSAEFDAYLDIFEYKSSASSTEPILGATITIEGTTAAPGLPQEPTGEKRPIAYNHLKYEYIGSVRPIVTQDVPIKGTSAWKLYEIIQGDCLYETTLGGGGSTVTGATGITATAVVPVIETETGETVTGNTYAQVTLVGGTGAVNLIGEGATLISVDTTSYPDGTIEDDIHIYTPEYPTYYDYIGPFMVTISTDNQGQPSVYVSGVDISGDTSYAGHVIFNGVWPGGLIPESGDLIAYPSLLSEEGSADVFIRISYVTTWNAVTGASIGSMTRYCYYITEFPGYNADPSDIVTEATPYEIRLGRISGVTMGLSTVETDGGTTVSGGPTPGTKPINIEEVVLGGDIFYTHAATAGAPYAIVSDGTVYPVVGGTFTGELVTDCTAEIYYTATGGGVTQIHYGDIYIDGRWM